MQRHRTLVVLRHAKSEWPDGVPDDERPLADRGVADAPAAGRWLAANIARIDLVVCSPAARARQTWDLAAAELATVPAVEYDEQLYGASAGDLLDLTAALPAMARAVVLVGHNPGLSQFVTLLSGETHELKTSAIAVLAWQGDWQEIDRGGAELTATTKPRG